MGKAEREEDGGLGELMDRWSRRGEAETLPFSLPTETEILGGRRLTTTRTQQPNVFRMCELVWREGLCPEPPRRF